MTGGHAPTASDIALLRAKIHRERPTGEVALEPRHSEVSPIFAIRGVAGVRWDENVLASQRATRARGEKIVLRLPAGFGGGVRGQSHHCQGRDCHRYGQPRGHHVHIMPDHAGDAEEPALIDRGLGTPTSRAGRAADITQNDGCLISVEPAGNAGPSDALTPECGAALHAEREVGSRSSAGGPMAEVVEDDARAPAAGDAGLLGGPLEHLVQPARLSGSMTPGTESIQVVGSPTSSSTSAFHLSMAVTVAASRRRVRSRPVLVRSRIRT